MSEKRLRRSLGDDPRDRYGSLGGLDNTPTHNKVTLVEAPSALDSPRMWGHHEKSSMKRVASSVMDEVLTLRDPTRHADDYEHEISTWSISFNLVQATCGVGILSLAATFAYAGVLLGIGVFVMTGWVTRMSVKLLLHAAILTGTSSFEALGEKCFGMRGKAAVQAFLLLMTQVGLCAYLVAVKAFVWLLLEQFLPDPQREWCEENGGCANYVLCATVLVMVLPLSLSRRLGALAGASLLGSACVLFFVGLSVTYLVTDVSGRLGAVECHELHRAPQQPMDFFSPMSGAGVFRAVAIVGASFACQFTVLPVYREVRVAEADHQASAKILRATSAAMGVVVPVYLVAAFSGYCVWRDLADKASSTLACYPPSNVAVAVCYLGMIVSLLCAFPLMCFSARFTLATIFLSRRRIEADLPFLYHFSLTAAIVGASTTTACLTDSLGLVLSVGSALSTPGVCYILPALCYLRAVSDSRKTEEDLSPSRGESSSVEDSLLDVGGHIVGVPSSGYAMLIFGIISQVCMLYGAFASSG
eukprot:Hpha_TRINITY_DN16724_c0_g9::TRINITY_DN16724_c0_g9_i1::g.78635::m.78635/K13576/SLC38A3, SNAT3; solute carrier family 38 (sodium-coupled neutral amino acid transporter), member 3